MRFSPAVLAVAVFAASSAAGCGHSDECRCGPEWMPRLFLTLSDLEPDDIGGEGQIIVTVDRDRAEETVVQMNLSFDRGAIELGGVLTADQLAALAVAGERVPIDAERVQLAYPTPVDGSERGRRMVEAITSESWPRGVMLDLELGPREADPGASAVLDGFLPLACSVRNDDGNVVDGDWYVAPCDAVSEELGLGEWIRENPG